MTLYQNIVSKGGGLIATGNHLGLMVGSKIENCPPGWVFLHIDDATEELFEECLDAARNGRKAWPQKM